MDGASYSRAARPCGSRLPRHLYPYYLLDLLDLWIFLDRFGFKLLQVGGFYPLILAGSRIFLAGKVSAGSSFAACTHALQLPYLHLHRPLTATSNTTATNN